MTDILCKWINDNNKFGEQIEAEDFPSKFANGYLFGQILHQYGLQADFGQFSKGSTSEAKLNNFMRLEPTFRSLNISFNSNMAHSVMTEKQGASTRLMYQIFVALHRKEKTQLASQSIESVRSDGKFKLEQIESSMFQENLKLQTPRQVDLNFEDLIKKFKNRHEKYQEILMKEKIEEEEKLQQTRKEACHKAMDKAREMRDAQQQLYARLRPVEILPDKPSKQVLRKSYGAKQRALTEEVKKSIDEFEETQKSQVQTTSFQRRRPATTGDTSPATSGDGLAATTSSNEYLASIHQRVQDENMARKEREKRRRKVLIDQMKSLQEQEESRRGEILVNRLMRQCQQERRIATQLMQIRKEKDVIRRNRVAQLQQYEERRLKEFEDALNREALLAQQKEDEKKVHLKQAKELHDMLQSKKAQERYEKHYSLCWDVLQQIVDLSTCIGEYKELAQGLVPAKVVRNWKVMLINGNPLYEEQPLQEQSDVKVVDTHPRLALLNDNDFWEYRNIIEEWQCDDEVKLMFPDGGNAVLSHVVYHLHELLSPAQPCRPVSCLPNFSLKACCIGKPFAGKSTVLKKLSKTHELTILTPDQLVQKAVNAYTKEKNHLDMTRPGNSFNFEESAELTDFSTPKPSIEIQPSSNTELSIVDKSVESVAVTDKPADSGDETKSVEQSPTPSISEPIEKQESVVTYSAHFSPLASLGQAAECALLSGQGVDDATIVDIILHEIKQLPEKSNWVIENFPTTLAQAQLLDKALSGFEPPAPPPKLATSLAGIQGHYLLIPKPLPSTEPQLPQSGFDIVLFFDVSSDEVFKRSSYADGENSEVIEGQPIDTKRNQIQNRLLAFEDNWVLLDAWFSQFNNLVIVNANENEATTQKAVSSILKDLNKNQSKAHKDIPVKPKSSPGHKRPPGPAMASPRPPSEPTASSARTADDVSNSDQTTSGAPAADDGHRSPEPGSPEWVYADLPIAEEMIKALAPKWCAIECSYILTAKHVFQLMRTEQETHCHYFYDRRMEIISYLKRPDLKQEYLSTWQRNYNAIPSNLRRETTMIAEQHQRVDDLCETLWDICDRRRDDAEKERTRVMQDNWIDDHSGIIVNQSISLMQCEYDKFQDAVQLLNEYYYSMEDPTPSSVSDKSIKLPLIELPSNEPQDLPASAVGSQTTVDQQAADDNNEEPTSPVVPAPTDSRTSKQQVQDKKPDKKVLVIPRSMPPPEVEEKGKKKAHSESPTQVLEGIELDEVLLNHAIKIAQKYMTSVIDALVKKQASAVEPAATDATTTAAAEKDKPEEKGKGGKGDAKKGKDKGDKKANLGKNSSTKKVDRTSPAKSPVEDASKSQLSVSDATAVTEKSKSKQEISRQEHLAALKHEERETRARLELVKSHALQKIQHIKTMADNMYSEMGGWIELSYKQECDSVSHLAQILKQAIENEQKILQEIKMPCKELQIDMSALLMELPHPPRPDTPHEPLSSDQFTIIQLSLLHQQLTTISPTGVVLYKGLVDTLHSLCHASYGSDNLPDSWVGLSPKQMDDLMQLVYPNAGEYVDWHTLLLTVAQPYPIPSTQDLLNALNDFKSVADGEDLISREQYDKVDLWFTTDPSSAVTLPQLTYDRYSYLKHVLFDMFADPKCGKLDYLTLLLYFSADHDSRVGLFKAISLLCGSEVKQDNIEEECTLSIDSVYRLLTHRAAHMDQPSESSLFQELQSVYTELSTTDDGSLDVNLLLSHPVMTQKFNTCNSFLLPDLTPHYHRCASPTVEQSSDAASH